MLLADAHRMAGQPQVALEHLTGMERLAEAKQCGWLKAEMLRLRGDLLVSTGDKPAGEANLRDAMSLAQRQGGKLFELRAATSLARLWRDQGKRHEAQALLALVYDWFTEGFDLPDLQEAKALLDELHA